MLFHDWISLGFICLMGAMSPGPSLLVILACMREGGKASGFMASIGHGIGVSLYALASATGLGLLLLASPVALGVLQFLGACFLFYVGWKLFSSALRPASLDADTKALPLGHMFRDGFLIAIFNPKIAIFFLSVFSQFLSPGQSSLVHVQMALVAGTIDTLVYIGVVLLASSPVVNRLLIGPNRYRDLSIGSFLMVVSMGLVFKQLYS
ncbi:export protein (LysE) [Candidatus Puniceispirillum marinum IMCC1322]|uniref:Export protein (LysE) n=2 Tax=Candidatus Puniceispirillum TaxID=767891 RepID=D5BQG3_PUNMI|nr:export protein (LysE) [Candidatus Puniceispirillum marinum IMCC1322]